MTASTDKIAVITTRLPYIDRRSLSQAWFSALHLASDGPVAAAPKPRATDRAPDPGAHHSASSPAAAPDAARAAHSRVSIAARGERCIADPPARSGVRSTAKSRAAEPRSAGTMPFRTSLTFGVHGERVALSLRREGGTLHVVAVCRPEIEGIVRRALACADLYLRVGGESVRASVTTVAREGRS